MGLLRNLGKDFYRTLCPSAQPPTNTHEEMNPLRGLTRCGRAGPGFSVFLHVHGQIPLEEEEVGA